METQTRFDLEAAIANWQQELAAQADLTPIVRRELETHLRDTVRELQGCGLNDEESFWLARRRLGKPQQLEEEFAKADPARVWRERTFWMVGALLAMNIWSAFLNLFWRINPELMRHGLGDFLPGWVVFYLPYWLQNIREFTVVQFVLEVTRFIPIVVMAVFISRGRLKYANGALSFVLASRARFFCTMAAAFFIVHSTDIYSAMPGRIAAFMLYQFPWTISLITLGTWLVPSRGMPTRRVA